ncbi:hypothetical protein [Actinomyces ruminis]|uniref:Uncharacterized protein n=1 Tax=Actinomyces ruminis TaxID=1937003 RepID=A0ABX4MAU3_9ACTO|nr:hypothetical protein [Actinomyces ruminis]PHP52577.1 hypothetical protein BW737_008825 [Actinomyces ruminis]
MSETITIRPTPAAELERGDLIRHHGETRQILRVCDYGAEHVVIYFHAGSTIRWSDALVDVVVPPEPAPEPEAGSWPTEPIIRILDGHLGSVDIGGLLALRVGAGAYRLYDSGDEVGLLLRDQPDAGIEDLEGLSVVPTEAIRALTSRLKELDIASPLSHDAAMARVVDTAEDLALVAHTGQDAD